MRDGLSIEKYALALRRSAVAVCVIAWRLLRYRAKHRGTPIIIQIREPQTKTDFGIEQTKEGEMSEE
jgi:hypothetical protein